MYKFVYISYKEINLKEYSYETASDRIFLRHLHKNAIKDNIDIQKYNNMKDTIYNLENELKRIKKAHLKTYTNPSEILNEQVK